MWTMKNIEVWRHATRERRRRLEKLWDRERKSEWNKEEASLTRLNPHYAREEGGTTEAPSGYHLVDLDGEAERFIFRPIDGLICLDEIVGVIVPWVTDPNDSSWLEWRVMRHPDGTIEFIGDISFAKGQEDEALAYAKALVARRRDE